MDEARQAADDPDVQLGFAETEQADVTGQVIVETDIHATMAEAVSDSTAATAVEVVEATTEEEYNRRIAVQPLVPRHLLVCSLQNSEDYSFTFLYFSSRPLKPPPSLRGHSTAPIKLHLRTALGYHTSKMHIVALLAVLLLLGDTAIGTWSVIVSRPKCAIDFQLSKRFDGCS